jgi:hypothetical protein
MQQIAGTAYLCVRERVSDETSQANKVHIMWGTPADGNNTLYSP